MIRKETRRGVALGAVFALLFGGLAAAPASAAGELKIQPYEGTSYDMLVTEAFELETFLTGVNLPVGYADLAYKIETPVTYGFKYNADATASWSNVVGDGTTESADVSVASSNTMSYVTTATSTTRNFIKIQPESASSITSVSPAATFTVTAFLDNSPRNGVLDAGEWSAVATVNFKPWSAITVTTGFVDPLAGDTSIKATATATGVNMEQLAGNFYLQFKSTLDAGTTNSAAVAPETLEAGSYSSSQNVAALSTSQSISATLFYDGDYTATVAAGEAMSTVTNVLISAPTIDGLTFSPVVGDNLAAGATAAEGTARINSTFVVNAMPYTGSGTAVTTDAKLTVAYGGSLSTTKTLTVNGTKYTASADLPSGLTRLVLSGKQAVTVIAAGFTSEEVVTLHLDAQNKTSASYAITLATPTFTLKNVDTSDYAVVAAGVASTFNFTVIDQWKKLSNRTNQRISAVTSGTGFSTSDPVTALVANGAGSVAIATEPAAKTGSAQVVVTLQTQNIDTGVWADGDTHTINLSVTVDGAVQGFSTSPNASYSGVITYDASGISYSDVTQVTVKDPGASITLSNPDLIFKAGTATASGTLTFKAGANGAANFSVASKKAGTHTFSITVGSFTTTSQLVVTKATADSGKTMTFDVSNIVPGSTATITGTLVDANGNPVDTSPTDIGTASLVVTYTGAGIPIGTMPTESDEDGKFSFTVLAGSADAGAATVTATYLKDGTSTATADKITATHAITIGAAAASVDQKITVGTFKGYVAIYTKGYMGQKLSAKVAGKWLVVDPIAAYKSNDYSRTVRLTGAGYTITVDLYIDGAFVRSEVVTTQ